MIHFGKTQQDELQIIVSGDSDIESLRQMIVSSSRQERRAFYGLKHYIDDNFTKH